MKHSLLISLLLAFNLGLQAQRFEVDTLIKTGALSDRINLVFIGDGYQESELGKFIEDVHWMLDAIFKKNPFPPYRDYFNAFAIKVPSAESGAANHPDSLINNYFGSTFNWASIWRLVVPAHSNKVRSVLRDNFPQYDQVFMLVNDSRYGGSGGWISTNTTHSDGPEICIHEMGHSFAGLIDEYWAGAQYAREGINMTREADPAKVKWARWIPFRQTGVYPHAEAPAWFRPHQNCEMRYLNRQFCPVCQEAIASKILALTNPLISYQPAANDVYTGDAHLDFSLQLLEPVPNTLRTTWVLNNDTIAINAGSLRIGDSLFVQGRNLVIVDILDTTSFIRNPLHITANTRRITWTVNHDASSVESVSLSDLKVSVYPNPASDQLNLSFTCTIAGPLRIDLVDMQGRRHRLADQRFHAPGSESLTVNLKKWNLSPGNYYLEITSSGQQLVVPVVVQ